MSERPLVSVVIPVYNTERYVGSTLKSVIAQTYDKLEIIIVIDGSTDCSHDICRQFSDARIRYVVQENQGLAAARNAGIREAKGRYIGFIDSDDTWRPEKVARHVEHLEGVPALGLSYSYSALMDEAGDRTGMYQVGTDPSSFTDCYVQNVIGNGSNAILRREVFAGRDLQHGEFPPMNGFDPELRRAEDYELWSRIALKTKWKIACIPEPLVNYRTTPDGLSSDVRLQRVYHFLAMAKIAEYEPNLAELLRERAVAHVYWHQARLQAGRKATRPASRAIRLALQYKWRTLNTNHALIVLAVAASIVLTKRFYFGLYYQAGRVFGALQKWKMALNSNAAHPAKDSPRPPQTSEMVKPPTFYVRKKAMPNLFFLCHKHRFMYLGISKNASTSMKQLMWHLENGNRGVDEPVLIHRYWGFKPVEGRSIDRGDRRRLAVYKDYLRFVVYRDPVSRFLSAYHSNVLFSPMAHPYYTGKRLEGMGLDQFIRVAESALKIRNPLHIDEHLRPQAWCYKPRDVDFIVPIEHLQAFLMQQFGIARKKNANRTVLPRIRATEKQEKKIRALYRCDYSIEPNWSPRETGSESISMVAMG